MEHMEIWSKVARPPEDALKKIVGGRLGGMTDINPQWRLKAMTEVFGPCGVGWRWTIERLWTEPGPSGEVMAFALVNVYTRTNPGLSGVWNEPIPGVGGSALVAKESAGLRANDEGFKMAITDALSVAFKCLGVAADIYERKWDGTKYTDGGTGGGSPAPALAPPKRLSERSPTNGGEGNPNVGKPTLTLDGELSPEEKWGRLLSQAELRKLFALVSENDVSTDAMKAFVKAEYGINSRAEIRYGMLAGITDWLKASGKAA